MSAVTAQGRVLMHVLPHAYRSADVVCFLRHLLRHIPGKLLIIWDGSPIHRSHTIKAFLASGGAARIHLEQLPAYAPELNPGEGMWYCLKRVELRNLCCRTLAELRYELRLAVANLRHKRAIVRSFAKHCGY